MRKKVFIGSTNVGNNLSLLAGGFRELGFEVGTGLAVTNNKFYDVKADYDLADFQAVFRRTLDAKGYLKNLSGRYQGLLDYDIYIFLASTSLLPGMMDLPVLKDMGKTVVCIPCGSDIRHRDSAKIFYSHFGYEFPQQLITGELNLTDKIIPLALQNTYQDTYSKKMYNTRMAEYYADVFVSAPGSNMLGVRPYIAGFLPFDRSKCKPEIHRRDVPVVLHAPTSRAFKQTDLILETLRQLKDEGVAFELFLMENLKNKEVFEALANSDIVVDQIFCGKSGQFGLEALGSGCALLGANEEYAQPIPFGLQPTFKISKKNLYSQLKRVITDKELRYKAAEDGLAYIGRGLHDPKVVARYLLKAITRAAQNNYDYYPTFFFEHVNPPHGEQIPSFLPSLTSSILQRYGTTKDILESNLIQRHCGDYLSVDQLKKIPVWQKIFRKRCAWGEWNDVYTGKDERYVNNSCSEE